MDQSKVSVRSHITKFQVVTEFFVKMENNDKNQIFSRSTRPSTGQSMVPNKSITPSSLLNILAKKSTVLNPESNLSASFDDNTTSSSQYQRPQIGGSSSNYRNQVQNNQIGQSLNKPAQAQSPSPLTNLIYQHDNCVQK